MFILLRFSSRFVKLILKFADMPPPFGIDRLPRRSAPGAFRTATKYPDQGTSVSPDTRPLDTDTASARLLTSLPAGASSPAASNVVWSCQRRSARVGLVYLYEVHFSSTAREIAGVPDQQPFVRWSIQARPELTTASSVVTAHSSVGDLDCQSGRGWVLGGLRWRALARKQPNLWVLGDRPGMETAAVDFLFRQGLPGLVYLLAIRVLWMSPFSY